jgi:hypothetical protein
MITTTKPLVLREIGLASEKVVKDHLLHLDRKPYFYDLEPMVSVRKTQRHGCFDNSVGQ